METDKNVLGFELSLSARGDGTLEAAYVRFKTGKVHSSKEIIEDVLIADYDKDTELLGIEILAPVKLTELAKLVEEPRRSSFRKFIKRTAPADLITV